MKFLKSIIGVIKMVVPKNISIVNVQCRDDILNIAYAINLELQKALEFGIQFLGAEKDLVDYPANNLLAKISKLQELLSDSSTKMKGGCI